jgi:hypothetical protein
MNEKCLVGCDRRSHPIRAVLFATLLLATVARAGNVDRYNVVWDSPSRDWHGSMPIGNGDVAANVWVEPTGDLVVLLSKSDALDANARLLKLGQLRIRLTPAPVAAGTAFRQELDLKSGTILIRSGDVGISLWIDANHPVVRIETQSGTPRHVRIEHETWRTQRMEPPGSEWSNFGNMGRDGRDWNGGKPYVEADTVLTGQSNRIVFYHRNEHSIWAGELAGVSVTDWPRQALDPLLHRTFGALVQADGMRNAGDHRLETAAPVKKLAINITVHNAITPTAERWVNELEAKAVNATPLESARRAHRQWWAEFWARSWIDVRAARGNQADTVAVSRGYALQRWITACAGRGGLPIKFNGSLFTVKDRDKGMLAEGQGPLHDHDYRRHGPRWWWQNTRMPYWPMLEAGDFEMMRPLFDAYTAMLPLRRHITRLYFQHDGAFYDESIYPWGTIAPFCYGTGAAREGKPLDWHQTPDLRYYWQGGLELTAMMFRYYYYTGDREFLRKTLLPFAHEIVTFYDQHYQRDKTGKIVFAPANALEDTWNCKNPAPEIAGLKANLTALVELADDATKQNTYRRMLAELPALPTATDKNGKSFLLACLPEAGQLPSQFPVATRPSVAVGASRKYNSEKPELYSVFPHLLYGVGRPGLAEARKAWDYSQKTYRKGGKLKPEGWSQDPAFVACLGLTDLARREIVARSKQKYRLSRFPAFWGPGFDWVPDQCHGGINMTALQKMLLQTDLPGIGRRIYLLPAWPKDWDCDFKLHAPYQTVVEGKVVAGKLKTLKVTPESRRKDIVIMEAK